MGKGSDRKAKRQESSRGFGILAMLAILTIVGVAIWFVLNQGEAH